MLAAVEKEAEQSEQLRDVLVAGQSHYEHQKRAEMREYRKRRNYYCDENILTVGL